MRRALLEFNRNRGPQPKLVALYQPEGTFYCWGDLSGLPASLRTGEHSDFGSLTILLPTAGPGVRAILAADPAFDVARFLGRLRYPSR